MAGQDESGLRRLMWVASDTGRRTGRCLLACAAITAGALAQLGDAAGERQVPIVPAEQIPPARAVAPEAALRTFVLAPGYQLELVACEPLVQDPVAMAFGPDAGDMPAFGGFADEEIAAVLTYIRQEWGHSASPIEPAQVAAIRAAAAGHSGAWSAEELRWIK